MKRLTGLQKPITGISGEPFLVDGQPVPVSLVIASTIERSTSTEPIRAMDVALRIYQAKDGLELEDADFEMAKANVEGDQLLTNMAKAAALQVFLAAEKRTEKGAT